MQIIFSGLRVEMS